MSTWLDHLKVQLVVNGITHCALIGLGGGIWAEFSTGVFIFMFLFTLFR
jgi:hypothetical protein